MTRSYSPLALGFSVVPAGKLASAVTCLEMREAPYRAGTIDAPGLSLSRFDGSDLAGYRRLFRAVGEDWLWSSRLEMSDEALHGITHDPSVEIYVLSEGVHQIGLLELDFREPSECEIVFLGVIKEAIGKGAGRFLIESAISIAWSRPISRFWLHTCHLDHPNAPAFYQSFGFKPCALWVEVFDDPRLTGVLPRTIAPHVPLLDPNEA